jgi:hypothetical protein
MTESACDCLATEDPSLAHYVSCPVAGPGADNTPERALAELASLRDIDTALYCLRELRTTSD